MIFQSTPPVKAATELVRLKNDSSVFQSTPPVKAATRTPHCSALEQPISIHAAREGGDKAGGVVEWGALISIHAAREGGDEEDEDK